MHNFQDYRIKPGSKVNLQQIKTDDDGHLSKKQGETEFEKLHKRLIKLQELLYAEGKHALLVILQAMDTGGKDSTIRSVFQGVNPQGCQVTSFKAPNETEQKHDFLWRIHQNTPPLGYIGIFNRSHYEDVLVARVKKLVPEARWQARYEHINCFEQMLHDEGTAIVKFFLHISQDYQKERLQRRLDKPDKRWKFNPADLEPSRKPELPAPQCKHRINGALLSSVLASSPSGSTRVEIDSSTSVFVPLPIVWPCSLECHEWCVALRLWVGCVRDIPKL